MVSQPGSRAWITYPLVDVEVPVSVEFSGLLWIGVREGSGGILCLVRDFRGRLRDRCCGCSVDASQVGTEVVELIESAKFIEATCLVYLDGRSASESGIGRASLVEGLGIWLVSIGFTGLGTIARPGWVRVGRGRRVEIEIDVIGDTHAMFSEVRNRDGGERTERVRSTSGVGLDPLTGGKWRQCHHLWSELLGNRCRKRFRNMTNGFTHRSIGQLGIPAFGQKAIGIGAISGPFGFTADEICKDRAKRVVRGLHAHKDRAVSPPASSGESPGLIGGSQQRGAGRQRYYCDGRTPMNVRNYRRGQSG